MESRKSVFWSVKKPAGCLRTRGVASDMSCERIWKLSAHYVASQYILGTLPNGLGERNCSRIVMSSRNMALAHMLEVKSLDDMLAFGVNPHLAHFLEGQVVVGRLVTHLICLMMQAPSTLD
jgi:hypothetical protein